MDSDNVDAGENTAAGHDEAMRDDHDEAGDNDIANDNTMRLMLVMKVMMMAMATVTMERGLVHDANDTVPEASRTETTCSGLASSLPD